MREAEGKKVIKKIDTGETNHKQAFGRAAPTRMGGVGKNKITSYPIKQRGFEI